MVRPFTLLTQVECHFVVRPRTRVDRRHSRAASLAVGEGGVEASTEDLDIDTPAYSVGDGPLRVLLLGG